MLKDPDSSVRAYAAWALQGFPDGGRPFAADVALLLTDEYAFARWNAAETLGKIGAPASQYVPELRQLLNDTDENVRKAAGEALKAIGDLDGPSPASAK